VGVAWSGHMERVAFHRDDQMETLLESQVCIREACHTLPEQMYRYCFLISCSRNDLDVVEVTP